MKIAIIGHGRMGQLIEQTALERGHRIVAIIDKDNIEDFESHAFRQADVAIEFTTPATAVENILRCFAAGVPVVCGSTGWTDSLPEVRRICNEGKGTMLFSSNFSIGVNIFRAVNRYLASIMNNFCQYSPSLTEVHHIHKLDHPSGTAITLAEDLISVSQTLDSWEEPTDGVTAKNGVLPISHERRGEVPGIHSIRWDSEADSITLTHSAKSRSGFALGAVLAAEWLKDKKGYHTIAEMLSSITGTTGIFE